MRNVGGILVTALRTALEPFVSGEAPTISVRAVMYTHGVSSPTSCAALVEGLAPLTLDIELNAGTCHGSCQIVLEASGQVTYRGHVHNNGVIDARYTVITSLPVSLELGGPVLLAHQGTVGGTFSPIYDDDDGWQDVTSSDYLRKNWWAVKNAGAAHTTFGTGVGLYEAFISSLGPVTPSWLFRL